MRAQLTRLFAFAALAFLAACASAPQVITPSTTPPEYQGFQDGAFFIEPVAAGFLTETVRRAEVDYAGAERPGTIVVDPYARRLYYVLEGGRAMRYGIAVGRAGLSFTGAGIISRKAEWPSWTPTANMIRTQPEAYAKYAGGLPGGMDNPLGARALYLYRNGRDTYFRIHGTPDQTSVGRATSAGCIRLFNQDAIDLYNRVNLGTRVVVRSLQESIALEGPFMDDAYGRAVPETAETIRRREVETAALERRKAAEQAAEREASLTGRRG